MKAVEKMTSCEVPIITLSAANKLIEKILHDGEKQGLHFAVSVVDAGGHLRAFGRCDHAPFLTVDISRDKAWTACSFGQPTHVWNQLVQDPHMAPLAHRPGLVAVGGGCAILVDGKVAGGVGVSGGTYEQDQRAAEQALEVLGF